EHVELGHDQAVETIDGCGVLHERSVEPTATARTAGDSAVLHAALTDALTDAIERLGGERAAADARYIRLGDADYAGNTRRRDAGSGASATGGRVGGRDEGISAVVDIEHAALRPFEHD